MKSGYQTGPHILHTPRLLLRPPEMSDVPAMHHLANDPEIAANLSDMPHPYPREAAAAVVSAMQALSAQGEAYAFAIVPQSESLVGVVYLILDSANQRAELIYWIGQAFWGRGYATEAAEAVIAFAFINIEASPCSCQRVCSQCRFCEGDAKMRSAIRGYIEAASVEKRTVCRLVVLWDTARRV